MRSRSACFAQFRLFSRYCFFFLLSLENQAESPQAFRQTFSSSGNLPFPTTVSFPSNWICHWGSLGMFGPGLWIQCRLQVSLADPISAFLIAHSFLTVFCRSVNCCRRSSTWAHLTQVSLPLTSAPEERSKHFPQTTACTDASSFRSSVWVETLVMITVGGGFPPASQPSTSTLTHACSLHLHVCLLVRRIYRCYSVSAVYPICASTKHYLEQMPLQACFLNKGEHYFYENQASQMT